MDAAQVRHIALFFVVGAVVSVSGGQLWSTWSSLSGGPLTINALNPQTGKYLLFIYVLLSLLFILFFS